MDKSFIGGTMGFGAYQWRILDVRENKVLLTTQNIIEQRPYHDAYTGITWADCALRRYLNGAFFSKFTDEEQSRVIQVRNRNPDNHWYGTEGGVDTMDRVFLLSMEETVCLYFGDSSVKLLNPRKNQRYWFERKDENNEKRMARLEAQPDQGWWWWLRTPGRVAVKAVYVHGDGNIGIQGNNILKGNIADGTCTGGVRPAMWVRVNRIMEDQP